MRSALVFPDANVTHSTAQSSPTMLENVELHYRDNSAQAPASPQITASQQPTKEELIQQFGNLIDGADAGLVPKFEQTSPTSGEAMAVIEETVEKVAANTKLIEEIREHQRQIESVTLKSSDLDAISDEMIRRLRSRMRLDRSRFA